VGTNLHVLNAVLAQGRLEVTVRELFKWSGKQDILDHEQKTDRYQNIPEGKRQSRAHTFTITVRLITVHL
jgi:protein subunit release factor A